MTPPPLTVDLTLDKLNQLAEFATYLRMEAADGGAEGFGLEGGVRIARHISRDAWEGLGCPVVLTVTLQTVGATLVDLDER
jgi:hypothetical protein